MINILQYASSIERLVATDYYINDLEKWHEFYMPKKGRGNPATVSPPAMVALTRVKFAVLWLTVLYKLLWTWLATDIRVSYTFSGPLFPPSPSVDGYFLFAWQMKRYNEKLWSFGNIFESCIIIYLLLDSDTHAKTIDIMMSVKTAHAQPTLSPYSAHIRDTSERAEIYTQRAPGH